MEIFNANRQTLSDQSIAISEAALVTKLEAVAAAVPERKRGRAARSCW